MFDKPITFKEADQALARRKDKTTYMKSREIALSWNADARARAFFSARVASATILSELHSKVEAVVKGQMTKAQARALMQRYFVGDGADALAELGFAPQGEGIGVAQLASSARLNLILDTNVKMAQEAGQYKQWAAQRDIYKYGIWKCGYSKEHRIEHLARDGKAYVFDHPIWTQSPPGGEFNCHCYRMLLREEDMAERGITPERPDIPFEPSSLGFNPARGIRKPPEFGKRVRKQYKKKAQEQMEKFEQEEEKKTADPVQPIQPVPSVEPEITPAEPAIKPKLKLKSADPVIDKPVPVESSSTEPQEKVDRFDGDGVVSVAVNSPAKIKEGVQGSLDAISEITGAKSPPFDSVHRVMTKSEIDKYTHEDGTFSHGIHFVDKNSGSDGKKYHVIAIHPKCPHPAFTDMHETVHAYIDEGIIREKEVEKIYQLIQPTETYKLYEEDMKRQYKKNLAKEWVTRAITWSWMSRAVNPVAKKERLAILETKDYLKYGCWKGFNTPEEASLTDLKLEEKIMTLTPKTFFGKLRRKLGFSDTHPVISKDDEIILCGITRKELQEHCDAKGITIDQFLSGMEEAEKRIKAMKPGERPLAIM